MSGFYKNCCQKNSREIEIHDNRNFTDSIVGEYGLYLIYSKWLLEDIIEFMKEKFLKKEEKDEYEKYIGPIRIDYIHGSQSERTLCLLHESLYKKIIKEGFFRKLFPYDFRIQPYEIRDNNKPGPGFSSNLYIPLPTILNRAECKKDLYSKLKVIESFGIIKPQSYRVTLPLLCRKTEKYTGSAFIEFSNDIPLKNRSITRLIMNDTDWNIEPKNEYRVKCLWAKDRTDKMETQSLPNVKFINN